MKRYIGLRELGLLSCESVLVQINLIYSLRSCEIFLLLFHTHVDIFICIGILLLILLRSRSTVNSSV
jgi:hypothetical protein